jgi:hypothetical protein
MGRAARVRHSTHIKRTRLKKSYSVLGHNSVLKYSLLNDKSFGLLNSIEEPDTKIEEKMAKIKIDFFEFFGVGCASWQCHFFFNTAVPSFFFKHFF